MNHLVDHLPSLLWLDGGKTWKFFFFFLETGLVILPKLAWKSCSSYVSLPSAGITSTHHHAGMGLFYYPKFISM
jgi:hypothetical protein